jgi:electron transport complex protein RnfB
MNTSGQVAAIDEPACIGCTLCIQVCPVDAILGTVRQMHTVIAQACTGCAWCVPVCPMDCITLQFTRGVLQTAELARGHAARPARLERKQQEIRRHKTLLKPLPTVGREQLQEQIAAAVARAKAKRQFQ